MRNPREVFTTSYNLAFPRVCVSFCQRITSIFFHYKICYVCIYLYIIRYVITSGALWLISRLICDVLLYPTRSPCQRDYIIIKYKLYINIILCLYEVIILYDTLIQKNKSAYSTASIQLKYFTWVQFIFVVIILCFCINFIYIIFYS